MIQKLRYKLHSILIRKDLIIYFAKRELRNRIAGNIGGLAWTVVQPLMMILMFIFIFSIVLKVKLPGKNNTPSFTLFMLSGFIPWIQFQEGVLRASSCLIENRDAVKKISFPLGTLIVGYILAVGIIYSVPFALLCTYCLARAIYLKLLPFVKIPFILVTLALIYTLQTIFTIGLGAALAPLAVYIRDILQVLPILMQMWFYVTPIVYPEEMVPEKFKALISINPWNTFVECYRSLLFYGKFPSIGELSFIIFVSGIALIIGIRVFKKLKDGFADVL